MPAFSEIPHECWYCQHHEVFPTNSSGNSKSHCAEAYNEAVANGIPVMGVLHNGTRYIEVDSRYANNCPLWQVMDHDKARATVDDDIFDQFRWQWG